MVTQASDEPTGHNGDIIFNAELFHWLYNLVRVLLAHGADFNLQNKDGITALMMSSYNGHTEIVELLIEHGADMHVVTSIGMTALRVSTDKGHKDITKLLIEYGASDHQYSNRGTKRPLSIRDPTISNTRVVTINTEILERLIQVLPGSDVPDSNTTSTILTSIKSCMEQGVELSLAEACAILRSILYTWDKLGANLNVDINSLKEIRHDFNGIAKHCLSEMLHKWLVRAFPPPSWEELAEAVENIDQTTARKIRRN